MTIYPIPITEEYTFTAEKAVAVTGEESLLLSAEEKTRLLRDWQRLLLNGCQAPFFTPPLYRFLSQQCQFSAHRNRKQFWSFYMDGSVARFRRFLAQFGGDRRSAEQGDRRWLEGPAADLKEAMCREATRLYAPLSQVLQDLEIKHEEMIAAWREFALAAKVGEVSRPAAYRLSENTRSLLAYAAQIARRQPRPLTGLQMMFPAPSLRPAEGPDVVLIEGQGGGR